MSKAKSSKLNKRIDRQNRIRNKIKAVSSLPRLCVFKSNKGMYAQVIDDLKSHTVVSAHTKEVKIKGNKSEIALELGKILAKKALDKKIEMVVFDKGGYKYHGRIKAIADGAREVGLKF